MKTKNWNWKTLERLAVVTAPIIFGLWSVWRGQDRNIDLLNYHYYNGYAFLNDRLSTDFAVAGFPTYFNPILDVGYYLLNQTLPAWSVGFLLGFMHGLTFVLLLQIMKRVPTLANDDLPPYFRLFLALTGVFCTSFIVGLGTSMGDTTTTPLVLAAVLLTLERGGDDPTRKRISITSLVLSGLLMGVGTGLKLTNAPYALAIFFALAMRSDPWSKRVFSSFLFGMSTLLGILISDGFWLYKMWELFGNPLFPQFSKAFPSELTMPIWGFENRFRPASLIEIVFWPLVFFSEPHRVSELQGQNFGSVIVAYLTLLITVAVIACRRWLPRNLGTSIREICTTEKYLMVFVAAGYILWMFIFSVYRYFVPIEVFAPFITFVLLSIWMQPVKACKVTVGLVALATFWLLVAGVKTYSHSKWMDPPFRAEIPPINDTQKTVAIVAYGDPPWGWLAPLFPPQVAFTQLEGLFPAAPGYYEKIKSMVHDSGEESYAIVPAAFNWRERSVANANRILGQWELLSYEFSCSTIRLIVDTFKPRARYVDQPITSESKRCLLVPLQEDVKDLKDKNRIFLDRAIRAFSAHNLSLDTTSCRTYQAYIGDGWHPYQWCKVSIK